MAESSRGIRKGGGFAVAAPGRADIRSLSSSRNSDSVSPNALDNLVAASTVRRTLSFSKRRTCLSDNPGISACLSRRSALMSKRACETFSIWYRRISTSDKYVGSTACSIWDGPKCTSRSGQYRYEPDGSISKRLSTAGSNRPIWGSFLIGNRLALMSPRTATRESPRTYASRMPSHGAGRLSAMTRRFTTKGSRQTRSR